MAYLHEMALKNAIKQLYMLGGPSKKRESTSFDDAGASLVGAVSGGMSAAKDRKALNAANNAKATANALARRDALVEGEENWQVMKEKYADQFPNQTASAIKDRIQANEIAENTRMAGRYTAQGLDNIDKVSKANAEDRLRARSMIGIGGSQRGY